MRVSEIPDIVRLSTPEKILLVEDLWDHIASDESNIPVPSSHKEVLVRRLTNYQLTRGTLLTLDELQGQIAKRT